MRTYRARHSWWLGLAAAALVVSPGVAGAASCTGSGNSVTCTGGPGAQVIVPSPNSFTAPHTVTANTFPSALVVSGAPAGSTVATVTLTLNGYTTAAPITGDNSADVGILLADPSGKNLQIMRCDGNGASGSAANNVNITLADGGTVIPSCNGVGGTRGGWSPTSGSTWAPGAYDDTDRDNEASPDYGVTIQNSAAGLGSGTLDGVFQGEQVNGTWNLYLADDGVADGILLDFLLVPPLSGGVLTCP